MCVINMELKRSKYVFNHLLILEHNPHLIVNIKLTLETGHKTLPLTQNK